jgi:nitroreductase
VRVHAAEVTLHSGRADTSSNSTGIVEPAVLTEIVDTARLAPSVHNTQPWQFRLGPGTIHLDADRSRTLSVVDPAGRQLLVSCGCAVTYAVAAAKARGLAVEVALLPDNDPDHLAQISVREQKSPGDEQLAEAKAMQAAIGSRHTQRDPFDHRRVEAVVVDALRRAAEAEKCWLTEVQTRQDQITLDVLLSRADDYEANDPEYRQELASWVRPVDSPAVDGVPAQALPRVATSERHSEVKLRDFAPADAGGQSPSEPVPDERPTVVILGSDTDTPADQLKSGMALAHVLLAAARLGVAASPLGQVVEVLDTRARLRSQLGLLGVPQMVLRIGYGSPAEATPRRPLAEVLQ